MTGPADEIGKGAAVDKPAGGTMVQEVVLVEGAMTAGVLSGRVLGSVGAAGNSLGGSDDECVDSETSTGSITA